MLDAIRRELSAGDARGVDVPGFGATLDTDHLARLKAFADASNPCGYRITGLCWTGVHGVNLRPLPVALYRRDDPPRRRPHPPGAETLERRFVIENVSSYISYATSTMSEWEFVSAIADEADCLLLLDINNIYVSSVDGFDPRRFIDGVPVQQVQQIHLAGHSSLGDFIIDTHDAPIADPGLRSLPLRLPLPGAGQHHDRTRRQDTARLPN